MDHIEAVKRVQIELGSGKTLLTVLQPHGHPSTVDPSPEGTGLNKPAVLTVLGVGYGELLGPPPAPSGDQPHRLT
ncbi:hypothetical protein [Mycolicibacterium peregrinum]|uniref:hypothetical protein n=1 Tax=Mycolicibacterium peregrinum TaxID=43304 RepID=UPI0010426E68|nr:hypothetical protein [Mycolicibacterium peregrinum]